LKQEIITKTNNPNYIGGMGHLIEEYHFEYKINSDQEPDFPKAGVELKVTPYEIGKKGGYSAGERLVIKMISYQDPVEEDYYGSHVYKKLVLTLLVHYLRNRSLSRMEYPINFVTLFSPPEEDLKIIQQDYEKIITKVKEGKAHELSEGETTYLGACTKGSTSIKSNVPQAFYAPELKAQKRAFCLKQSYMTYILNKYVRKNVDTYESILSSVQDIEDTTFENLIVEKINKHLGKTDEQLMSEFDVLPGAKNFWSSLAYRMLGIKSNRAEEFEKANIEVKTISLEENGSLTESISFPHITFKEFVQEEWQESDFYNDLSSKRFLMVVFKRQGSRYVLKGCKLWNITNEDLDVARIGWETIQQVVRQGVKLWKKYKKNVIDFEVKNNFPKKEANRIIHIRPHTSKRYYKLDDGEIIGNNPSYDDELPDGRIMTKQCFWLNNTYILSQLDENLKK
jgi:DNA mismatch repair protein MutH